MDSVWIDWASCMMNYMGAATELHDAGIWEQEVLDQSKSMLPVQGGGASKNKTSQVTNLGSSDSFKRRTLEPGHCTGYETHIANNIRRKRYFGEISTGHAICTVSSDSERNVDIQCKDASQDLKKLILAKKDSKASPNLVPVRSLLLILYHSIKKQHACTSCGSSFR